jgi:hypothetical protein
MKNRKPRLNLSLMIQSRKLFIYNSKKNKKINCSKVTRNKKERRKEEGSFRVQGWRLWRSS